MEENRLKPMAKGYDPAKFNRLYQKTEGLRRKLAAKINPHKFGLDYEEILNWFTVKFIHTFNKYHDKKEDLLLGDIINSLQNFSCRIMRKSYTIKFSQSIIRVGYTSELEDYYSTEQHQPEENKKLILAKEFMKNQLTDNAYTVFEVIYFPPMYILNKLNTKEVSKITKIPDHLICEYLDIDYNDRGIKYLNDLKKEIRNAISHAAAYFQKMQGHGAYTYLN